MLPDQPQQLPLASLMQPRRTTDHMQPPPRTPLRTEIGWILGLLLASVLIAVAGFAMFMDSLRAL